MITKSPLSSFISGLIITSVIICYAPSVQAQSLGIEISPPQTELIIQPGKSTTQTYTIKNVGMDTVIQPILMEYRERGQAFLPAHDPTKTWLAWKETGMGWEKPMHILPEQAKTMTLSISIPESEKTQTYARVIVFQTVPLPPNVFSQSQLRAELASIFILSVATPEQMRPIISLSSSSFPKIIDSFDMIKGYYDIKNSGNVMTRISGSLVLKGAVGSTSRSVQSQISIPTISTRIRTSDTSASYPDMSLVQRGIFVGPYTLTATVTDSEGHPLATHRSTLLAIPWKLVCAIFVLFFIIYIVRCISSVGKRFHQVKK